jgi:hypothetical protein
LKFVLRLVNKEFTPALSHFCPTGKEGIMLENENPMLNSQQTFKLMHRLVDVWRTCLTQNKN